jgi:hypothetical protein
LYDIKSKNNLTLNVCVIYYASKLVAMEDRCKIITVEVDIHEENRAVGSDPGAGIVVVCDSDGGHDNQR